MQRRDPPEGAADLAPGQRGAEGPCEYLSSSPGVGWGAVPVLCGRAARELRQIRVLPVLVRDGLGLTLHSPAPDPCRPHGAGVLPGRAFCVPRSDQQLHWFSSLAFLGGWQISHALVTWKPRPGPGSVDMWMQQGAHCLEAAGAWLVFWSSRGARSSPQSWLSPGWALVSHEESGLGLWPAGGTANTHGAPQLGPGAWVGARREPGGSQAGLGPALRKLAFGGGRVGSCSMVGWVPCGPSSGPAWPLAPPGVHPPCPADFLSHPLSQVFFPGVAWERRPPLAPRVANAL